MSELRLIVGLGNPGKKYDMTRHNLGFVVVKRLAQQYHLKIKPSSLCKGNLAEGEILGKPCCLLFPLTYMNNSGIAVKSIVEKKEVAFQDILVVCDDFNLDFGQLRIRRDGSDGGHNGLSSVIYHLNSSDFVRLRVGIGVLKGSKDPVDFVLEEFTKKEGEQLSPSIQEAVDCCLAWLTQDMEKVMCQFNKRKGNG